MNKGKQLAVQLYQKAVKQKTGQAVTDEQVLGMIARWTDEDKAACPEMAYGYNRETLDGVKEVVLKVQGEKISDEAAALMLDSLEAKRLEKKQALTLSLDPARPEYLNRRERRNAERKLTVQARH